MKANATMTHGEPMTREDAIKEAARKSLDEKGTYFVYWFLEAQTKQKVYGVVSCEDNLDRNGPWKDVWVFRTSDIATKGICVPRYKCGFLDKHTSERMTHEEAVEEGIRKSTGNRTSHYVYWHADEQGTEEGFYLMSEDEYLDRPLEDSLKFEGYITEWICKGKVAGSHWEQIRYEFLY